jgi:hypothetical protein
LTGIPAFKSPAELIGRLDVPPEASLLLIDAPEPLVELLSSTRAPERPLESVTERSLRGVKNTYDAVLLWREDRVGSEAALSAAVKRLNPSGAIWVVTAMRKVTGPRTPAAHRLDRHDLEKAFARPGLLFDREARFSAWHAGYRFRRRPPPGA